MEIRQHSRSFFFENKSNRIKKYRQNFISNIWKFKIVYNLSFSLTWQYRWSPFWIYLLSCTLFWFSRYFFIKMRNKWLKNILKYNLQRSMAILCLQNTFLNVFYVFSDRLLKNLVNTLSWSIWHFVWQKVTRLLCNLTKIVVNSKYIK